MKILRLISIYIVLAAGIIPSDAQDLLGIEGEEATLTGIYIKDLVTGEILYDYNSDIAMTPASVMKSVTTATALSLLGDDFRFSTPVVLRGRAASGKNWHGDLVVMSSGDPTVESENFKNNLGCCDSICSQLRKMEIEEIDGAIVIEQTLKDAGPVAQWEIEDVAWPYGAGLYGMNYRDNTCLVYPMTGETRPFVPGLKVTICEIEGNTDLIRGVGSDNLTVYASKKSYNNKWSVSTTMPDPSSVFVAQLSGVLKRAGIKIGPKAISKAGDPTHAVYIHNSPSSAEIMRSLMVRSDNLFAEGILRAIAPGDTRKNAISREKELWSNRGIDSNMSQIFDGSGLARGNRLQPIFIADVLQWMAESPLQATYVSFFPKAGLDGTMRTFLDKSPLKGKIALKTGSMNAVQCYAGYKLGDDDTPTHIIVILVNGFFCKRGELKRSIENLLLETFQ